MSFHVKTIYNRINFCFFSISLTVAHVQRCSRQLYTRLNESIISLTYRLVPITVFKLLHDLTDMHVLLLYVLGATADRFAVVYKFIVTAANSFNKP